LTSHIDGTVQCYWPLLGRRRIIMKTFIAPMIHINNHLGALLVRPRPQFLVIRGLFADELQGPPRHRWLPISLYDLSSLTPPPSLSSPISLTEVEPTHQWYGCEPTGTRLFTSDAYKMICELSGGDILIYNWLGPEPSSSSREAIDSPEWKSLPDYVQSRYRSRSSQAVYGFGSTGAHGAVTGIWSLDNKLIISYSFGAVRLFDLYCQPQVSYNDFIHSSPICMSYECLVALGMLGVEDW
jgi:hypothetical protein